MRLWLAMPVVLIVALAAAGCGGSSSNNSTTGAAGGTTSTTGGKALKVGLVTDIGGLNDKSFNYLANQGLQQAKAQLGIDAAVKESHSNTDYVPNLQSFAQQGYDLVIAVGFLMSQAIGQVAKKYPNTKFAIIDQTVTDKTIGSAKNVEGLLFKEQDAGYLVGYLAGLLQKQGNFKNMNKKNTISSVGGLKIPPVDRYIAGYQAGAKAANPKINLLNGYSNDFTVQSKCKGLANTQIAAGSDVIFQVAGGCGLGALDAAGQANVWGIGVDNDQSAVGPQVLASAVKKVNDAVFITIRDLQHGRYDGGTDRIFGLKENGVDIAGINSAVPASVIAKVNAIKSAIKSGKITPPDTVK
jgi:basic membrane protein A